MSEPTLAVQTAINGLLAACQAAPIYDRVPDSALPPYIVIGDDQFVSDKAEGLHQGGDVFSNVHVFYYGGRGRAGAKAIAAKVMSALDGVRLDLGIGYVGLETIHVDTHYLDEPDGKTVHAVISFKTLVDAVAAA